MLEGLVKDSMNGWKNLWRESRSGKSAGGFAGVPGVLVEAVECTDERPASQLA